MTELIFKTSENQNITESQNHRITKLLRFY